MYIPIQGGHVGTAVHDPAVTKDDSLGDILIDQGHFCEPIFQIHLQFHQGGLKLNDHLLREFAHIYHRSSDVQLSRSLRHDQNFEPSISQKLGTISDS